MHPETVMFVPKGVGFVPYMLPGSVEIATETLKPLKITTLRCGRNTEFLLLVKVLPIHLM